MSFTVSYAVDLLEVYSQKAGFAQQHINPRLLLKALNIAQREVIMYVIGLSTMYKNAFDLLVGLQATKSISVPTTGYAISGLHSDPGRMINPAALYRAEATLSSVAQRFIIRQSSDEVKAQNQYLRGNDEFALLYFENNKIFVDIDSGSYPATVSLYYIRDPKELVATGATGYQTATCELTSVFEEPIMKLAQAEMWKIAGDKEKYQTIRQEVMEDLRFMVTGSAIDKRTAGEIGQFTRKEKESQI